MENVNNSNEYDSYLVNHCKSYMVTEFLGRGQYEKTPFKSLEDASLSKPPHAIKPISIAIS